MKACSTASVIAPVIAPAARPFGVVARLALVLTLVLPWAGMAPAHAQVRPDVAEQLMQASGAWPQLGAVSPSVQTYLLAALDTDASGAAAQRQEIRPISQALQKAFAPERLRTAAAASLARQLSADDVARLREWFASPLGQQVTAVEAQGSTGTADATERLREGTARVGQLSPERRALLGEVLSGTRSTALQTEVLIQALQAIHRGTSGIMPRAAKVSPKELRSRLESQRAELALVFQGAGLSLASGFYAALSDAQLAAYRDFLNSPWGERLHSLQQQAINQALREATEEASRQMGSGEVRPGAAGMPQPISLQPAKPLKPLAP